MNGDKFPAFLKPCRLWMLFTISCVILLGLSPAYGKQALAGRVAIILSKNIKPYLEAAEGLKAVLTGNDDVEAQLLYVEDLKDRKGAGPFAEEGKEEFVLFAAVGPEAAEYIWSRVEEKAVPTVYCMVLNPEQVIGEKDKPCGIPLNIPVSTQIATIQRALPFVRRLGLLYDPQYNSTFLHQAAAAASSLNLTVVPLQVSAKKDIPAVLMGQWNQMDALWLIPDRTVISESIVAYLIKEAFLRKMPVIGYNRYFYDTGAALAFVFNYVEQGRQCANKALEILSGGGCGETPPIFSVWVNEKILDKLGRRPPGAYLPPIEPGP